MASPTALLFDLDGTLVDSERLNGEAAVEAVERRGARLEPRAAQRLRDHVIGRTWGDAAIFAMAEGMVPPNTGRAALEAEMVKIKLARVKEVGLPVLPHAVEAMTWARRRGMVAVVSGSKRVEIEEALAAMDLTQVVPSANLVGAEDYEHGKPAPDPFLEAARRLKVSPQDCLVIEDSSAGIRAAHAAGMRVIAVRAGNVGKQDQSAADRVIETLAELPELVGGLAHDGWV
jgi:HAD superfamily hydrolase (TIGR01509 family)